MITYLPFNQDHRIAYRYQVNNALLPYTILYLHGLNSSMQGTKGQWLEEFCRHEQLNLLCLDYLGHGSSSGELSDCLISDWFNSIQAVLQHLQIQSLLVIGSSLGGWLGSYLAKCYPQKVKGYIGLAPAIDFPTLYFQHREEFLAKLGFKQLKDNFIEDSTIYNLFPSSTDVPIPISCPVTIIQGMQDKSVDYRQTLRFVSLLTSNDVRLELLKNVTHGLSEYPYFFSILGTEIHQMLQQFSVD